MTFRLSKVLVVSGSSVLRDLLRRVLAPHCGEALTADGRKAARTVFGESPDLDLVISETSLPDGDGLTLLCDVALLPAPRPEMILVAGRPDEAERQRASELGAIGYLPKPVRFDQIAALLKRRSGDWVSRREPRRRPGGRVWVLDPADRRGADEGGTSQLLWFARDLSASGAFLETESPFPIGAKLDLALELGDGTVRARAVVVRVQEPGWGHAGGIGVSFVHFEADARERIAAHVLGTRPVRR